MNSLRSRVERLTKILEIPLKNEWENFESPKCYSIYHYWRNLGILSEVEFNQTLETKCLKVNPRMIRFFKAIDFYFPQESYYHGIVADVGSGFGYISFWLLLSGADCICSIGDPLRIEWVKKLYFTASDMSLIGGDKIIFKNTFIAPGDVTLSEEIKESSLSLVLLNDTLEHITPRILPSLAISSFNCLKKGGKFISRQQNTDSKIMRTKLQEIWEQSEKEIFIPQRMKILQNKIPNSKDDILDLAKATRGLDSIDFREAIDNFILNNTLPSHNMNVPPIDVETDVADEGDTGIIRVSETFVNAGFSKIKTYPSLMHSRKLKIFQKIAKKLPSIFMKSAYFNQTSVFEFTK